MPIPASSTARALGVFEGSYLPSGWSTQANQKFHLPDTFFVPQFFQEGVADLLAGFVWNTQTVRSFANQLFEALNAKNHPKHFKVHMASITWKAEVLLSLSSCMYCSAVTHMTRRFLCENVTCDRKYLNLSTSTAFPPSPRTMARFVLIERIFDRRIKIFYLIHTIHEKKFFPIKNSFDFTEFHTFLMQNVEPIDGATMPDAEKLQVLLQYLATTDLSEVDPCLEDISTFRSESREEHPGLKIFLELEESNLLFQILGAYTIFCELTKKTEIS